MPSGSRRKEFVGVRFDCLATPAVVRHLRDASAEADFRYVVTPNVDHIVRLHRSSDNERALIARAYEYATLCVCDSRIVSLLARLRGTELPVCPGSDLTVHVVREIVQADDTIALIGGSEEAVRRLRAMRPDIRVEHHKPPMGLLRNEQAMAAAAAFAARVRARFCFIAVGSPQQELLAYRIQERGDAGGVALCIGAAVNFLVGLEKRAPAAVQRLHLEWAHRLLSDPKRLWRRYLLDGPAIFWLAFKRSR
jgi:exopolysaccharide biosynthesis WecB/TagA/CpsF family protein